MRFEEAYYGWAEKRLTQGEAARRGMREPLSAISIETKKMEDGLIDLRLTQVSHRRAPVDEVISVTVCILKG